MYTSKHVQGHNSQRLKTESQTPIKSRIYKLLYTHTMENYKTMKKKYSYKRHMNKF